MSLLGLLPIIQLVWGASSWRAMTCVVGGRVFFGDDFYGGEVGGEAGAGELVGLLGAVALGHEDEAVARGELGKGFGDAGEKFDFLFGDGAGEAADALAFFFGDGVRG